MIKAIMASPVVKKVAVATMLTTAVVGTNATNLKVEKNNNTYNQTEVVSKETATAMRNLVLNNSSQKNEHNKKIDKLLLDTCGNRKEVKDVKNSMEAVYRVFGTYGAIIELQRSLDDYYIDKSFENYFSHYNVTDADEEIADQVISHFYGWRDNVYYTELFKSELEMYGKTDAPSAAECIAVIDNHINNKEFFKDSDVDLYEEFSNRFISKQVETESVQAKSDLLAYKVHLLNSIAFSNYFLESRKMPCEHIFLNTLGYDFINGKGVVKP